MQHPMTEVVVTALEDRYLAAGTVEVKVAPGDLDVESDAYAEIYTRLCDAAVQLMWPEKYSADPADPVFHTSNAARQVANVLMVAAGYRRNE